MTQPLFFNRSAFLFLISPSQVHPIYVLPIAMLISPGVSFYRAKKVTITRIFVFFLPFH
jgi:hypothetical protein